MQEIGTRDKISALEVFNFIIYTYVQYVSRTQLDHSANGVQLVA